MVAQYRAALQIDARPLRFGKFRPRRYLTMRHFGRMLLAGIVITLLACCGKPPPSPEYIFREGLRTSGVTDFPCDRPLLDRHISDLGHFEQETVRTFAKAVTADEIRLHSEHAHAYITKDFHVVEDSRTDSVRVILIKLGKVFKRQYPSYDLKVFLIRPKDGRGLANAFCSGTYLYVTTDLYEMTDSKEELAFVLGHEIGHLVNGHISDHIRRNQLSSDLLGKQWGNIGAGLYKQLTPSFGHAQELACDMSACYLSHKAGYDPQAGVTFFQKLYANDKSPALARFLSTHPHSTHRIACLRGYLQEARTRARRKYPSSKPGKGQTENSMSPAIKTLNDENHNS